MTKTTLATEQDHHQAMGVWWVVDASQHVLGRMAVTIAETLMGKHKPLYTPHINVGDGVIVVNAAQAQVTGDKGEKRVYRRWSGYPGGLKERTLEERLEQNAEDLVKRTVRRMLPKTRMGRQMLARLKVYAGAEHPHAAQKPQPLQVRG
jgi:large subunit ribosomal protein L13